MVLLESVSAVGVGLVSAVIGGALASRGCNQSYDPDSDHLQGCGWESLGGSITGLIIGFPLGQTLGVWGAGRLQGKRGSGLLTLTSAYLGDAITLALATRIYHHLDENTFSKGSKTLFNSSILIAGATMLAIPVATYTYSDYVIRFPLSPSLTLASEGENTRFELNLVHMNF
jgi:hypothetical protein